MTMIDYVCMTILEAKQSRTSTVVHVASASTHFGYSWLLEVVTSLTPQTPAVRQFQPMVRPDVFAADCNCNMGVSINGGTPIAGWFIIYNGKSNSNGYPPFQETSTSSWSCI